MWRIPTIALAGCTFTPPPVSEAADATSPDAAEGAPPRWVVVETLTVNIRDVVPVTSMTNLAAGVTYRLRASGVAEATINGLAGDAEYWDFDAPKDEGCCEDIGLGIDDVVANDKMTLPNWGPYTDTHIYEADWVGRGAPITALFQDTVMSNNVGTLTLEILEFKVP